MPDPDNELWQIVLRLAQRQEQSQQSEEQLRQRQEQFQQHQEQLQQAQIRTENSLHQLQLSVLQLSEEMRLFKEEMLAFKEEINRAWGNLANKLGTILEDIAAPNIERFSVEEFGFSASDLLVRARRTSFVGPRHQTEFDVICAGPEKVIYAEMKSSPSLDSLSAMQSKMQEFFDFFPEYRPRALVGVYASWSLDKRMRLAISAAGLYGVAMGNNTMEIVARPAD